MIRSRGSSLCWHVGLLFAKYDRISVDIRGTRFFLAWNALIRSFLCLCTLGVPFPSENDISGNKGHLHVVRPYSDSSCQEQSIGGFGFT